MAQQLLIRRQDSAALPLLEKQALESNRPLCRLHALCTLDGLDALKPALLERALRDAHPGVRRHAVRLCESRLARAPQLGTVMIGLLDDTDPQVQMQLAYTLGAWDDPQAGTALGRLALQAAPDRFLVAAALSSVNKKNLDSLLLTVFASGQGTPPPAALTENLLRLAKALGDAKTFATLLRKVTNPVNGRYAAWQFAALAGLLDALDQGNDSLAKLEQRGDEELKAAVRQLGKLFAAARAIVSDAQAPLAERLQALRLLGRGPDRRQEDLAALAGLLVPQTAEEMQSGIVAGLGRLRDPSVPQLLLRGWKGYSPALRSQVLDILLARQDWLRPLLDALERKQLLAFEIDAARRQRLLQHKTSGVRDRAATLLAGGVNPDRQKVIDAYQAVLKLKGDASRGRQIFTKNCASCHLLGGVGHQVGPDLASVGDKSSGGLLTAVLDPNRSVEARYINYTAVTKNGLTLTGVLASETGNSITLLGPDGKQQVILRTDLEELVSSNKSAMPEGLEKDLQPQDLADLFAFIRSNGTTDK
jgi:putative heme-binding domain-containing protein